MEIIQSIRWLSDYRGVGNAGIKQKLLTEQNSDISPLHTLGPQQDHELQLEKYLVGRRKKKSSSEAQSSSEQEEYVVGTRKKKSSNKERRTGRRRRAPQLMAKGTKLQR